MRMRGFVGTVLAAALVAPGLAAGEGQSSVFAGGIGNSIITLAVFLTVVYILGKYAWPPLLKTLEERERTIRDALESARRERLEAERLLVEYRKQLEQARVEATAIVEEGRRDADAVRRRVQDEARAEAQATLERAKREIQLATDAAVTELYSRSADLSVKIASTVIEKSLSVDDHRKLVDETLERMKASGAARLN